MKKDVEFDSVGCDYERQLDRGLSLSGQKRDHFIQWRVKLTKEWVGEAKVLRILDYGCAEGLTSSYLLDAFPAASYIGFDPSKGLIEKANEQNAGHKVKFITSLKECGSTQFDLIYTNGVFHHIPRCERASALQAIRDCLSPTGIFAFWENNPWHVGTQIVMALIPFDRGAQKISPRGAVKLLTNSGFTLVKTKSAFHFPYSEKMHKSLYMRLLNNRLGAQYCLISRKK